MRFFDSPVSTTFFACAWLEHLRDTCASYESARVFLCDLEKRIACVSSVGVVLLMVKSTVKLHISFIKKKGSFIYHHPPSLFLLGRRRFVYW